MRGCSFLLVGGKGYLGSLIAEHFTSCGAVVRSFDLQDGRNVSDVKLLTSLARGVDWVINLVGPTIPQTERCPRTARQIALVAAENSARAAQANGAAFIQLSSVHVYGESTLPAAEDTASGSLTTYGSIKRDSERVSLRVAPYATVVRLAAVYDEQQRPGLAPSEFGYRAVQGQPLLIHGNGQQGRQYLYWKDFLSGIAKLIEVEATGTIVNLAGSETTTINNLAQIVQETVGRRIEIASGPERHDDVSAQVISTCKIRDLGWRDVVPMKQGIEEIVRTARLLNGVSKHHSDHPRPHRI